MKLEKKMLDKLIYLDNAAATQMDKRVLAAMTPYFLETYAVATSQFGYSPFFDAKVSLDLSREYIGGELNA